MNFLTEVAHAHNNKKKEGQPKLLSAWMARTLTSICNASDALKEACIMCFERPSASPEEFAELCEVVVVAARQQLSRSAKATDAETEYFQLLTRRRASEPLDGFVNTVPETESLLCSEEMADLRSGAGLLTSTMEKAAVKSRIVELEAGVLRGLGFEPHEAPQEGGQRAAGPVLEKQRALVAERALLGMQREMEGLLQDIKKIWIQISRDTYFAKQSSKCRNKKRNLEGQLKKVAGKYNKIIAALAEVPDGAIAREPLNVERLFSQGGRRTGPAHWRRGGRPRASMGDGQQGDEAEADGAADEEKEREPWCF